MAEYQGHKNKTHWNVSLYLNNEYNLYQWLVEVAARPGRATMLAKQMCQDLPARTPDGYRYSVSAVAAAIVAQREASAE